MTRLKSEPFGKIQYMKKIIRRIAAVAAAGLAPLAFVTVISPAVSSADCAPGTEWWDPVANVCRPTGCPYEELLARRLVGSDDRRLPPVLAPPPPAAIRGG